VSVTIACEFLLVVREELDIPERSIVLFKTLAPLLV